MAALWLACASSAQAQGSNASGVEAAFAAGWLGGLSFGTSDASLRTRTGDDSPLFSTESTMGAAPVFEARATYPLTSRYAIEGRFGFAMPEVRTSISGDVEGAPSLDVAEQIDQYTFDGALLVMFGDTRPDSVRPFISLGAGYLRQLHEGQTLVENGVVYHVGGGVRAPFMARQQGLVKTAGARVDGRLNMRNGGIALGEESGTNVSFVAGVFVGF
jgi:hypothetical protein